jgi:predicted nucleic acid-binding Zn finger protein
MAKHTKSAATSFHLRKLGFMSLSQRCRLNIVLRIIGDHETIQEHYFCSCSFFTLSLRIDCALKPHVLTIIVLREEVSQNDAFQMTQTKMSHHGTIDKSGR